MIETIDSFYRAVKTRIITLNNNRLVRGPLDSADWPPKTVDLECFYLLTLGSAPVGKTAYSPYSMIMNHTVQWTWIVAGQDLSTNVRGKNRGNRYRTTWQMKKELMSGLYPYFAEKLLWSAVQVGNQINLQSQQMTDPATNQIMPERITWTPPTFTTKVNSESGLMYSVAVVHITDWGDTVLN